jgi:molybdate transport system substrate-binding protein
MRYWRWLLIPALCLLTGALLLGARSAERAKQPSLSQASRTLYVPCGGGLKPVMDELGEIYFKRTGVRVDFAYAGAGLMHADLVTSRRGDLYIPGGAYYVDLARQLGFVAEDKPLCYMTPVIGVRKGNPAHVTGLQDLARPKLRVALGDAKAVAIGPISDRILRRAGLATAAARNISMRGSCVWEMADAILTHTADAAIVWDNTAFQDRKDMDALPIPPQYNEVSEVLVARLTCSKQPDEAKKLMAFLTSQQAAAILRKHGYATQRPGGLRLALRGGERSN